MTDRPLRIGLVAPYDLSQPGGINSHIRAQARALRRRGHDVRVYGPASAAVDAGEQPLGGSLAITISGTRSGLGVDPRGLPAVGRMLREGFDLLHVHEPLTPLVPWIVIWRARCPLVGTFHIHREGGHKLYRIGRWALGPMVRKLAARIAVSESARQTVASPFPGSYEIVPNGIDLAAFQAPQPRPPDVNGDRRYVLFVGRLEPRKGLEFLIRAMPEVQRRIPDAALLVVGDGAERRRLTDLAGEVGARARFAGLVTDSDLPAYFQAADVVCSPALRGESFGIVLLEAMACGKPIVASRIDGYTALVGETGCACLVQPEDPKALSRELTWLLESPDRRQELGRRGRILAERYDWDAIAQRLEVIYSRVLQQPG